MLIIISSNPTYHKADVNLVREEGESIESYSIENQKLVSNIINVISQNEVKEIVFQGPKDWCGLYIQKLQEKEIANYGKSSIKYLIV